jgi:hypothetical protein
MAVPPMIGQPEALILYSGAQKAFSEHEKALGALGTASYLGSDAGLARCTTSRCSPPSTACFRRHPRLRTDRFGKGPGRKIPANADRLARRRHGLAARHGASTAGTTAAMSSRFSKAGQSFSDGRSQGRLLHTPEPFDNLEERMNVTAFSSPSSSSIDPTSCRRLSISRGLSSFWRTCRRSPKPDRMLNRRGNGSQQRRFLFPRQAGLERHVPSGAIPSQNLLNRFLQRSRAKPGRESLRGINFEEVAVRGV